jgi:hypothetical protein
VEGGLHVASFSGFGAINEIYDAADRLGVPVFIFQEGPDVLAAQVFGEMARLTKGAHLKFAAGSARELAELLRAVAAFAVGA